MMHPRHFAITCCRYTTFRTLNYHKFYTISLANMLNLSYLCSAVEKGCFEEIMYFHHIQHITNMATIAQEPLFRGHKI